MPFQKPRILTNTEENVIRGKCLMNDHPGLKPTAEEVMQLIWHFDLLVDKYRGALETLQGCFPKKIFVYGAYGEMWSSDEPDLTITEEFEVIDFNEILGESDAG
jgi:hypothetical protein